MLSSAELVAPAFAAAALGGRVLGNGMTADSLWVALATLITQSQTLHGWDLLEVCLTAGDVLYLTMPANRLEQLWQSAPAQFMRSGAS